MLTFCARINPVFNISTGFSLFHFVSETLSHPQQDLAEVITHALMLFSQIQIGCTQDKRLIVTCLTIAWCQRYWTIQYLEGIIATLKRLTRRDLRHFNPTEFLGKLSLSQLECFECSSVDGMWTEWEQKFVHVLDECAPVIHLQKRKKTCPFMSRELLDLIHLRKSVYRKLLCKGHNAALDRSLLSQFRRLRCQCNNLYRRLRNDYYRAVCLKYRSNPRSLRQVVNSVTG